MIKEQRHEEMPMAKTSVPGNERPHKLKVHHKIPVRQGVSQYVLEAAKRLKEEYQADLDYLQEH